MIEQSPSSNNTTDPAQPKPKRSGGVQPRKQANKNRAVVKKRRKKIIKDILAGKTNQEAGIAAGFSPKTAAQQVSQTLRNPIIQNALLAEMEKIGMDDAFFAQQHRELILGTKIISATIIVPGSGSDLQDAGSMSKDFIEVPDLQAKAKGLEMAYKLTGRFTEKHEVDVKRPVNIIIRKFCSRGTLPTEGAAG
jgi:hypothetical protein